MERSEQDRKMVEDGLVTVKEAAAFLSISIAKVYGLMGGGELCYIKLGRSRRIPRRALVELATKNLVSGGQA
jgi:excisionase family DNA binding protein